MEIYESIPARPYTVIGPVRARVTSKTAFSRDRTVEEVNAKLGEVAADLGATGVINVQYQRGISATSWKALTANGIAVVFTGPLVPKTQLPPLNQTSANRSQALQSDEMTCPDCAETIKREARRCRFCGKQFVPKE